MKVLYWFQFHFEKIRSLESLVPSVLIVFVKSVPDLIYVHVYL